MNPSPRHPWGGDRPPTDIATAAAVRALVNEFHGRIDQQEVRAIVADCYEKLIAHVPLTVNSYLVPWARNRITHRLDSRREATLTEILLAPVHRL